MSDTRHTDIPPVAYLNQLIDDVGVVHTIFVAAKLGIADLLTEGPRSPADLAHTTGIHPRSLYRMLRALASRGMFSEDADGRFSLTPLADPLPLDPLGAT